MNHETELRIQAWLDGELAEPEAREAALEAQRDPAFPPLVAELKRTKAILQGNELPRAVPETREFYWSKIERAIRAAEPVPAAETAEREGWSLLVRFLAPAAVVAAFTLLLAVPTLRGKWGQPVPAVAEIESPLEDISMYTFRSEAEGMTVYWIAAR